MTTPPNPSGGNAPLARAENPAAPGSAPPPKPAAPPPPETTHWGTWAIILVIIIGGAVTLSLLRGKKTKVPFSPPVSITVTNVQQGDIAVAVSSLGSVVPIYTATMSPRVDGQVVAVNSIGLIQAYQTVLGIGESLSVNGTPPVNYLPADYALQQAAGQISGLDVVLGNEAYAEYSDPTIGFTTGSTFSSLASSIFAFQDQVDSLLDQELDLLRGRDDTETSVTAYPVFNRLYWNFTGGNGQVAYVSTFNITDVNGDGFINSADAQIMFPQGHGDAWGYYLSALTSYYNLLRNTNFTWENGTTAVPIDGVAVVVNFQDDAAFAHAAAAKAQTGADIVQKTYESAFISNPSGQYQGYYDTDTNRAWGLSEWARRAGQGAYFDWVTANSLIATVDPNTNDTGLNLVDRRP